MFLPALGWLVTVALLAGAVSSGWHGFRDKARGAWIAAGLFVCAAFILLAVLGAVAPVLAAILAFLAAAVSGVLAWKDGKGAPRAALGHAGAGFGYLGRDARGIAARFASWFRGLAGGEEDEPGSGVVPLEDVHEYARSRAIPSVMDDPHLGPPSEPAAIASAGIPVPAAYAALAQFIGGFEPEDDQALRMFMEGCAMGSTVVGEAWHHFADTLLNGVGLSPAYVAGILEAGDSAGEHASLLAQVHKRLKVIYGAIQEWIATHGPLPYKAREFLTGEEG